VYKIIQCSPYVPQIINPTMNTNLTATEGNSDSVSLLNFYTILMEKHRDRR
jgi:hypothetical protein